MSDTPELIKGVLVDGQIHKIDYNALANKPSIPSQPSVVTQLEQLITPSNNGLYLGINNGQLSAESIPTPPAPQSDILFLTGSEDYLVDISVASFSKCLMISANAFSNAKSTLTEISFPLCQYIAPYMFDSCSMLSLVNLPNVAYIGEAAFSGCVSIYSINIGNCVKIGDYAFYSCYRDLWTITAENCKEIGKEAFANCSYLDNMSFPQCVKICDGAFRSCGNLKTINISNCEYIGAQAFYGCTTLSFASEDEYHAMIKLNDCGYIGTRAFYDTGNGYYGYPGGQAIYINDEDNISRPLITESEAFANMLNVDYVKVDYRFGRALGTGTFKNMANLKNVYVIRLSSTAPLMFAYCSKLSSVMLANCNYIASRTFAGTGLSASNFNLDISGDDIYEIGERAFEWCAISQISLSMCSNIGSYAFFNARKLESVSFNSYYSHINTGTFNGCELLSYVNFPLCTCIESFAFSPNSIGSGLSTISFSLCSFVGEGAFARAGASSAYLPKCEILLDQAFAFCPNLSSITLDNCEVLGSSVFWSCSNLSTLSLPKITFIGNGAFASCTTLSSLYLLGDKVCVLGGNILNTFWSTPIYSGTGTIYVKSELYSDYIVAPYWSSIASRIVSM